MFRFILVFLRICKCSRYFYTVFFSTQKTSVADVEREREESPPEFIGLYARYQTFSCKGSFSVPNILTCISFCIDMC